MFYQCSIVDVQSSFQGVILKSDSCFLSVNIVDVQGFLRRVFLKSDSCFYSLVSLLLL